MRKPFYRKQTRCWYVKDDAGNFIRLDPDEEKAFTIWERMRRSADFRHYEATLEASFEAFLADMEHRVSEQRFADYTRSLSAFATHFEPHRLSKDVTASDVLKWVKMQRVVGGKKRQWSLSRQRDAGQAVKRALGWSIRRGYLPWSDVLELEFSSSAPRETLISYEDHCKLVAECKTTKKSRPFGLLLIALRLSGARPANIRELTSKNVSGHVWMFRQHKTARKTGKPLIVRCGPCLQTLTRILIHARPKGPLFLTALGTPWPKDGLALRFRRVREKAKLEGVTAYSYRHSYATSLLEAGVSIPTVATLMGHSDISMVSRVYGHLEQKADHLDEALKMFHKKA